MEDNLKPTLLLSGPLTTLAIPRALLAEQVGYSQTDLVCSAPPSQATLVVTATSGAITQTTPVTVVVN